MSDEKKLIIDEDWKSQVQAEKDAAASGASVSGEPASAGGPHPSAPQSPASSPDHIEMPPASLEMLITTLATETLVALGQIPHPATGEAHLQRSQAQYLIDTIDVLREKTKGNLTPAEQQLIESVLHQLRMLFVETTAL